jgi:hypothetical protein
LINAHANFRNELATDDIEQAEPKGDMIFLETARERTAQQSTPLPQQIG